MEGDGGWEGGRERWREVLRRRGRRGDGREGMKKRRDVWREGGRYEAGGKKGTLRTKRIG